MRFSSAIPFALTAMLALSACEPVTTLATTAGGLVGIGLLEERSAQSGFQDRQIQLSIHHEIDQQGWTGNEVFVLVYEKEVMLAGYVQQGHYREKVKEITENTEGVQRLHNEIRVGTLGTEQYFSDRALGVEVSTRLSLEEGVHAVNYTIRIVDGIVYMLGLALSDAEWERVQAVISSINGIRGMVSQVRVRSPEVQAMPAAPSPSVVQETPTRAETANTTSDTVTGFAEESVNIQALEPIN